MMRTASLGESTPPTDPDAEDIGRAAGEEQLSGELPGEGSGELIQGDEKPIDDVGATHTDVEKTEVDPAVVNTDPDDTHTVTTTNTSGTVQAQGEIRSSTVATPGGSPTQTPGTTSSPGDESHEAPTDPTQAPSAQAPSTSDDGSQNTTADDNGTNTNTNPE